MSSSGWAFYGICLGVVAAGGFAVWAAFNRSEAADALVRAWALSRRVGREWRDLDN